MAYPETIQYLESFINYEKVSVYPYQESLKLERIRTFLDTIGRPQGSLRCIHVAGSKGKGSTCAFISYILKEAGYKVGLYTSPHLSDFRERIRILCKSLKGQISANVEFEGMIPRAALTRLVRKLKPAFNKFNRESEFGPLTFFEVYTALAFVYFKEHKIDLAVLETGLGGRLDATNVVSPLVCCITPISYEHTQKLGNTLKEIAGEKAGIIKDCGISVISAPQEKEAMEVISRRCKEVGAKLIKAKEPRSKSKVKLIGNHQLINAAVAVEAVKALRDCNIKVSDAAIKRGLQSTFWPARCEVIAKRPLIVLDGAQNTASAEVLKKAVKENFKYDLLILVLGISNDKDIAGICRKLSDLADKIILTKANNPRAADSKMLADNFDRQKIYLTGGVKEAKAMAMRLAKKNDLILVTGSLFVAGEFRDDYKRY